MSIIALIVDYGYEQPTFGETLQAMSRHRFVDPFMTPGDADLTAHVDFYALSKACGAAKVWGPVGQGVFLQRLGIETRAARLKVAASTSQAADIDAALRRLTHGSAMGDLFKVLAVCQNTHAPPPGFDA